MGSSLLGLLELFIVLGFALGWAVLELVGLRLDQRRRREEARRAEDAGEPPDASC
jgi:hypothetical protein